MIHQTALGRALLDDALNIVEALEREYAEILDSTRFNRLKKLLSSLLDEIDPLGRLGRD